MDRSRSFRGLVNLLAAVGFLLGLPAQAQRGGLAAQQTLVDLVDRAGTIIHGHVVFARVEPHPDFPNLTTVVVTLRVQETLKGQAGDTLTFRQYIWDLRDRTDGAGYRKGGELLLFLTPPSEVGLSSPVGLGQGRFRVIRNAVGQRFVVNEAGNVGLFWELRSALESRGVRLTRKQLQLLERFQGGPLPWDELRDLIRGLAGTS